MISRPLAAAVIGVTLAFSSRAAEGPTPMTANDLASRMSTLRQSGESYVRLRMEIKGATSETLQLQIKPDRTGYDESSVYRIGRLWQLTATRYLVGPVGYLDLMNRDPLLAPVSGILAAQEIKPQARVLAEDRGIRCVVLDYNALRGMKRDDLTLF